METAAYPMHINLIVSWHKKTGLMYTNTPTYSYYSMYLPYCLRFYRTEQEIDTIICVGVFLGNKTGFVRLGHNFR